MLAILAPGQGAQSPGQLRPWLDLDGVSARLRWWSAAAGVDLLAMGTDAPAETIRDTAVAQPLLVATGLVAAEQLGLLPVPAPATPPDTPAAPGAGAAPGSGAAPGTAATAPAPTPPTTATSATAPAATGLLAAGHSIGEITAAAVAGMLTPEVALLLAALRGRAMAAACAESTTGMTALLGGDSEAVTARLAELDLTAANRNGAGQVVAAGTAEQMEALAANPPQGAKLRALSVAGAFHTRHMASARDALAAIEPGVPSQRGTVGQVSNADGAVVTDGAELLARLVAQVASPVRWDLCMATLRDAGVSAVVELPPAGVLTGIARRELPGVTIVAVKSPANLQAARELVAENAGPAGVGAPPNHDGAGTLVGARS